LLLPILPPETTDDIFQPTLELSLLNDELVAAGVAAAMTTPPTTPAAGAIDPMAAGSRPDLQSTNFL
jgi:hypothetical protein